MYLVVCTFSSLACKRRSINVPTPIDEQTSFKNINSMRFFYLVIRIKFYIYVKGFLFNEKNRIQFPELESYYL